MSKYDHWLEGNCGRDDREEARAEAIDDLAMEWQDDPDKCHEADEWNSGSFDSEHYEALETAMADLDGYAPDRLIESDLLPRLMKLAKVHGEARRARLREMAENELMRRECDGPDYGPDYGEAA